MVAKSNFLPHVVRLLIEAAGEEAALTIVQKRGGSRLAIPKNAEGSIIEQMVGLNAARAIVESLAGERLEIPLAKRFVNYRFRESGMSQERRAQILRLARRTIQNWDSSDMPARNGDNFETS